VPRLVDEGRRARARELYAAGATEREIAGALSASTSSVRRWLDGAPKRPPGPRASSGADQRILELRHPPRDPERAARGLPAARPASFAEIARLTGMSRTGARMRYYALTGRKRPDRPPRLPVTPLDLQGDQP